MSCWTEAGWLKEGRGKKSFTEPHHANRSLREITLKSRIDEDMWGFSKDEEVKA